MPFPKIKARMSNQTADDDYPTVTQCADPPTSNSQDAYENAWGAGTSMDHIFENNNITDVEHHDTSGQWFDSET
jgi:hypothetical protein